MSGFLSGVYDMRYIKLKIIFIITVVCASIFLIGINAIFAASAFDDQYGVYYRHGRVFGKIIHYDLERDLVIVFGSVFVSEPGGQWRRVESRKFHLVKPAGNDLRETLAASVGRTVGVEGQLMAWPGQKEEILEARSVDFHDCRIETPPWYAFVPSARRRYTSLISTVLQSLLMYWPDCGRLLIFRKT